MSKYIPEKGDFIALSFDPQSGHEQKGRRPAIVVSNFLFNKGDRLGNCLPNHKHCPKDSLSFADSQEKFADRLCDGRTG